MNLWDALSGFCDAISASLIQGGDFRIHSIDSHRAVVLKLEHASESPRELVRTQISESQPPEFLSQDSVGLGWDPILHFQISRRC